MMEENKLPLVFCIFEFCRPRGPNGVDVPGCVALRSVSGGCDTVIYTDVLGLCQTVSGTELLKPLEFPK